MVSQKGPYAFFLFMISPLIAFVLSIRDYRTPWAKNIVWAFIAFYGFTFVVVGDYDATRYIEKLRLMHETDVSLTNLLSTIYTGESSKLDFVEPLITFFVSRFTSDQRWLMLAFAIVFGYFHSRNLWFLLDRIRGNFNIYSGLLFFAFAMVVPMSEICVFRWMCASQVFLFGVFNFFLADKRKGILWICFTPLIHFTFILGVSVFLLYWLIGVRKTFIIVFFASSFLVSGFDQSYVKQAVELLPGAAKIRYSGYLA